MNQRQIKEVDYGTFMKATENQEIKEVQVEENRILYTLKGDEEEQIYKTGLMNDPGLTERLYESGAEFSSTIQEQASPLVSFLLSWVLPVFAFVILGQQIGRAHV